MNEALLETDILSEIIKGIDPTVARNAAAYYQAPRIARERHMSEDAVATLITQHIRPRQFGLLGEPRVNVLALNLALAEASSGATR